MTTPAVTFDFAVWAAQFPELTKIGPALAQGYFARACNIFDNSVCNPAYAAGAVPFTGYLFLLTAHVAFLNAPRDDKGNPSAAGQAAPPLVGRISSASEGSVSVSTEFNAGGSPSEAYFTQTRYGAEFWQATAQWRTGVYMAQPTYVPSGVYPSRGYRRFN